MTSLVELRDVTKVYPGAPPVMALHPTSLRVDAGDQVAIVGDSGSGKSTLLSILGTLDDPTSGSVFVDGVDLSGIGETRRSRIRAGRIGFVFQQFHLIPALTAMENVEVGLLYSGIEQKARRSRAATVLEEVGLGHRLVHRPSELSGGEQQRVAIARALVRTPAVVFADEPTGALDSTTGESIVSLLRQIADAGTAVVMVTHNTALAQRFSRRIRIRDGRAVELHGSDVGSASNRVGGPTPIADGSAS